MGSDASYNERRLLWKAVCFVWAVTGMRRTPRPMGAKRVQAQPARIREARGFYGKSVRPIMSGGFHGEWYALCELYLA